MFHNVTTYNMSCCGCHRPSSTPAWEYAALGWLIEHCYSSWSVSRCRRPGRSGSPARKAPGSQWILLSRLSTKLSTLGILFDMFQQNTSKYKKENEGSGSENTPMPSYAILWSTLQAETHKTLTSPHLRRMGTLCAPSSYMIYMETSVIWWWSHAAILLGVHSRLKNNLFAMDRLTE